MAEPGSTPTGSSRGLAGEGMGLGPSVVKRSFRFLVVVIVIGALPLISAASASATAQPVSDLLLENHPHDVGVTVLRRDVDVRVTVVK